MKKKSHVFFISFSLTAIVSQVYCLVAYRYLQPLLKMDLAEQTPAMERVELMIIPALMITGLYLLYQLINALKVLPKVKEALLLHSLYIVFLVISGILILSDVALLSDIGKEYPYWDVSEEWSLLYFFGAMHLTAILVSIIYRWKYHTEEGLKNLFAKAREGNDILFILLNQIAFICGILGLLVIMVFQTIIEAGNYRICVISVLSILSLMPLLLFAVYWILKCRKKNGQRWLDEKQVSDTCFGSMVTLAVGMPILGIVAILFVTGVIVSFEPFFPFSPCSFSS